MRTLSKLHPESFKKIQAAFKLLRKKHIYAKAKALDFDNSGSQDVIFQAAKDDPSLRGGVYWNEQAEYDLDSYPVIWLGFTACSATLEESGQKVLEWIKNSETQPSEADLEVFARKLWKANEEERKKNAIQIAAEANEALKEAGLRTAWNGCVCTTIQIGLDKDFELEAPRSCVCEKIWAIEFARKAETELGQ